MHRTSLHRKVTILDMETNFQGKDSIRSAKENKDNFVDSLGVKFDLPSEYILDAKIHTEKSQYLYQFVKYVFPTQECVLSTHKLSHTRAKHSFYTDEYKKYVNALILRKLKLEGKLLK